MRVAARANEGRIQCNPVPMDGGRDGTGTVSCAQRSAQAGRASMAKPPPARLSGPCDYPTACLPQRPVLLRCGRCGAYQRTRFSQT